MKYLKLITTNSLFEIVQLLPGQNLNFELMVPCYPAFSVKICSEKNRALYARTIRDALTRFYCKLSSSKNVLFALDVRYFIPHRLIV